MPRRIYQHSQQKQECERGPRNFHLITTMEAHICFHRLFVFIPFFFFSLSFSRQKLQLLLMTGNLKVPLLNSHRCHVVRIKQTRSANS